MSRYLPDKLRRAVAELAGFRCEYCRRLESDSFIKYHVDHIVSIKHGGKTVLQNLAYSCSLCNGYKGSDLGTLLKGGGTIVPLFNPRKQDWFDHFSVSEGLLIPKSDTGNATIKLLRLNEINRILERMDLIKAGLFP